jgi:hypothetical protein
VTTVAKKIPTVLQLVGKYIFDMGKNLRATMDAVEKVRKEQKGKKA